MYAFAMTCGIVTGDTPLRYMPIPITVSEVFAKVNPAQF